MKKAFKWLDKLMENLTKTTGFCGDNDSEHKNLLKLTITELKKDNPNYFDLLTGANNSVESFHNTLKTNNIVLPSNEGGMFGATEFFLDRITE